MGDERYGTFCFWPLSFGASASWLCMIAPIHSVPSVIASVASQLVHFNENVNDLLVCGHLSASSLCCMKKRLLERGSHPFIARHPATHHTTVKLQVFSIGHGTSLGHGRLPPNVFFL